MTMVQWRVNFDDSSQDGVNREWEARKHDFLMRYDKARLRELASDAPEAASAIREMIGEAASIQRATRH